MAKDNGPQPRAGLSARQTTKLALRHGEMEWVNRAASRAGRASLLPVRPAVVRHARGQPDAAVHRAPAAAASTRHNQLIPPAEFLPAAERYNLMPDIDRWVVTHGVRHAGAAPGSERRRADRRQRSRSTFRAPRSARTDSSISCATQFTQFKIPHSQICFEITETTAITSLSKATDFMLALQRLGCRFALDDFGVGVSSFTYLKNLPVDFLKIDGSFVTDMLQNPVNHAMVEAIHRIGHIMGKKTIAESVESTAILEALRGDRRRLRAGFAIARPAIFGQFSADRTRPRCRGGVAAALDPGTAQRPPRAAAYRSIAVAAAELACARSTNCSSAMANRIAIPRTRRSTGSASRSSPGACWRRCGRASPVVAYVGIALARRVLRVALAADRRRHARAVRADGVPR